MKKRILLAIIALGAMTACNNESVKPSHSVDQVFTGDGYEYRWTSTCACRVRGNDNVWHYWPSSKAPGAKGCLEYSTSPCE